MESVIYKELSWWVNEENIEKDKFLTIRTTSLESFLQCEYKYFMNDDVFTKYSIFHIGKQLHKYMQARMLWKNVAAERILCENMTLEESDFIIKCWDKLEMYDTNEWTEYSRIDMNEMTYWLYIEYEPFLIYFEGTLDGVRYNEDGSVSIIDLKSSSSMWKDEDLEQKLQMIAYSWLYRKYNPNDKIRDFTYLVFDKKTNPNFKPFVYKPNKDEVNRLMEKYIKQYITAYVLKDYKTNRSWKCNWCKLKKDKTCPEFIDI